MARAGPTRAEADELLRQQQETFDQHRDQDRRWFELRVAAARAGVVALWVASGLALLAGILAAYVILDHDEFDGRIITASAGGFSSAIAFLGAVWRVTLRGGRSRLAPVMSVPDLSGQPDGGPGGPSGSPTPEPAQGTPDDAGSRELHGSGAR